MPPARSHPRIIIAHHPILTGYGHWLPNDLRGSWSADVRNPRLAELGPVHMGRKRLQPSKAQLREFSQLAQSRLAFAPLWFDKAQRQALADAVAQIVKERKYTVWACAVLRNHVHLVVRRHRDDALTMWRTIRRATQTAMRSADGVPAHHPIWSAQPYKVFLFTPDDVRGRITYVENNPPKEAMPRQTWPFVTPYDGWPYPKAKR